MSEPQANNDELQNYEIPITDLTSDGNNPILSPSTGADVITAVGGVTPERFWMVFMVIISIALGLFIFIGGGYLANEISSKNHFEFLGYSIGCDKISIKEKTIKRIFFFECIFLTFGKF